MIQIINILTASFGAIAFSIIPLEGRVVVGQAVEFKTRTTSGMDSSLQMRGPTTSETRCPREMSPIQETPNIMMWAWHILSGRAAADMIWTHGTVNAGSV